MSKKKNLCIQETKVCPTLTLSSKAIATTQGHRKQARKPTHCSFQEKSAQPRDLRLDIEHVLNTAHPHPLPSGPQTQKTSPTTKSAHCRTCKDQNLSFLVSSDASAQSSAPSSSSSSKAFHGFPASAQLRKPSPKSPHLPQLQQGSNSPGAAALEELLALKKVQQGPISWWGSKHCSPGGV